MNKKNSTREDSKFFDLTALKVLLSVIAICLASMMTNASSIWPFVKKGAQLDKFHHLK